MNDIIINESQVNNKCRTNQRSGKLHQLLEHSTANLITGESVTRTLNELSGCNTCKRLQVNRRRAIPPLIVKEDRLKATGYERRRFSILNERDVIVKIELCNDICEQYYHIR